MYHCTCIRDITRNGLWILSFWSYQWRLYINSIVGRESVQLSLPVMSDSLWRHGLQQAKLPCPSLTPGACLNSCPLSRWCHPTIWSSVIPFSLCPQSFPASGSFPVSQLFALGGQSIEAPASASVLPMNIQGWFPLRLTGLISLLKQKKKKIIYF